MEIQIFGSKNFGSLRVALNEKGETLFCLVDVCKALGIGNPSDVKKRLDSTNLDSIEVCTKSINRHGEYTRKISMTFIGEPNLYRCIFQSKKDDAKQFQDWVFGEVLPQIRKTGGYVPVKPEDNEQTIMARALEIMQRTLEQQSQLIESQRPMYQLGKAVSGSEESVMVGQMAKILHNNGIDIGRQRFFDWLRDNGYIFKNGREPMQKWIEAGIMDVRENTVITDHGVVLSVTPMITGKGQEYFLRAFGVLRG